MMAFITAVWMTLAAIGGGMMLLRCCGLLPALSQAERLTISFVLGIGVLGWMAFFAGLLHEFTAASFAVILSVQTLGLVFMKSPARPETESRLTALEWLLVAGIAAVLLMDFAEGLAPAAGADSMAYHFETPRRFLAEHRIFAIPLALNGVTQLLLQLTYGMALGLGGKAAIPLWTMISGWSLGALFYVLARQFAGRTWALAGTLILLSTPAIIYAAGTGQVEPRVAAFALLGAYAVAHAAMPRGNGGARYGWVIIAGLAAGFFAGSKMTGLIFAFGAALTLLGSRPIIQRAAIFSIACAVAGCQWYLFNWQQTGDPLYPMLWQHLELKPGYEWNRAMAESMDRMLADGSVPRNLLWFLVYPFRTIIAPLPSFESFLTGVGPAALMFFPFAGIAFLKSRSEPNMVLVRMMVIALVFYAVWFFFGPSLLVRHLIPVYPIVFLCLLVGVSRFTQLHRKTRSFIALGTAAMIAIQLGGHAVFTKKFARYLITGEQEAAFLQKNISGYPVVAWVNRNLTDKNRVLVTSRDWLYLLDVPYFMAHASLQKQLDLQSGNSDIVKFIRELKALNITHAVINEANLALVDDHTLDYFFNILEQKGCIRRQASIPVKGLGSRTLPKLETTAKDFVVFDLDLDLCLNTLSRKAQ